MAYVERSHRTIRGWSTLARVTASGAVLAVSVLVAVAATRAGVSGWLVGVPLGLGALGSAVFWWPASGRGRPRHRRRRTGRPPTAAPPVARVRAGRRVRVSLLFGEARRSTVIVDGLAESDSQGAADRSWRPFSLLVRRPRSAPADSALLDFLAKCCDGDSDVEIFVAGSPRRAVLCNAGTEVSVDLAEPVRFR